VDQIKKICSEKNWVFFPVGCHPAYEGAVGLHIHVGTFYAHRPAVRLANLFSRYVPPLGALMANSPIWGPLEIYGFKTMRVFKSADWCSSITYIMDPDFAQALWGHDVASAIGMKPTMEVRIADCPLSQILLVEYTALVTALLASVPESEEMSRQDYVESIANRWRAARDGLQATLSWNGEVREVRDILCDFLDEARPGYESLGAEPPVLIPAMLDKRLTQADFQMLFYEANPDPHAMSKDLANALAKGDPFSRYVHESSGLEAIPLRRMEDEILSLIGEETPYWEIYERFRFPVPWLEDLLDSFEKEGKIRSQKTPERGVVFTRLGL
jgi:hypothetical protein